MPESRSRRRGGSRPSRARRSGTATTARTREASAASPTTRRRFGIRPRTWRKIRRWGFIGAVAVVGLLVILSFALQSFPGGFGSSSSGSGEQVGQQVSLMAGAQNHLPPGDTFSDYSTIPPTSGPHWGQPDGPTRCGIYDKELPDEATTHNLEHGHVVLSHNLKDPQQVEQLKNVARDLPERRRWLVLRPYSKIKEGEVAIAAWGWIQRFQGVNEDGLKAFYGAHFGQGPEFAPCT